MAKCIICNLFKGHLVLFFAALKPVDLYKHPSPMCVKCVSVCWPTVIDLS